jgi:hypothetical protein
MLTRWATFAPGTRMPDGIDQLDYSQRVALQDADADLFALLSNTASAELELAAMNGSLASAAPTPEQLQDAAKQQRIAELVEAKVFGTPGVYLEDGTYQPGIAPSITGQFELESLDPQLAAQLRTQATPPAPQQGLSEADAARINSEVLRLRYEAAHQQPTPVA